MSKKQQDRKSSRKSRRRRISVGFSSEWQKFEPTEQDWAEMEKAYGQKLSIEVRSETQKIVQQYFKAQPFEQSAPFLDNILKRLEAINNAIKKLQNALGESGADDDSINIVRAQLDTISELYRIDQLDETLRLLCLSAEQAKLDFTEQSIEGFEEGRAWQEMAFSLKELMRSRGMPHGASQDDVKQAGSPFVDFFAKLQETFPVASLRRQSASPLALSKQISLAVKAHRSQREVKSPLNVS